MNRQFNLSEELEAPEVTRFEKTYSEKYGRQIKLRDIPIKNFVDTTTGLLQTKVNSLFMKGATEEAGFWPELINVVNMSAAIEKVPLVSSRDFKVRTGKMPRTGNEQSGGKFREVKLDTTNDEKIRYVYLEIDGQDVKLRNYAVIERSIMAAGEALGKKILSLIMAHYVSKAGNSQARSTDLRYQAIVKAIGLNRTDGFGCTAVVFEGSDFDVAVIEESTAGTTPWLTQLPGGQMLGDNFGRGIGASGNVGTLFSRIPVYVVSNDSTLDTNILCIDSPGAAVFGWAPGGQIELAQEVQKLQDLIANKIGCKFDFNSPDDDGGLSNAIAKVTGA